MRKIGKAQPHDLPSLAKCFRRVEADLIDRGYEPLAEDLTKEGDFALAIEEGTLFVSKEGSRVIAACTVSHDLAASFFPKSLSQKKISTLLDTILYQGEDLVVLSCLAVDPAYQRQGNGHLLFQAVAARYSEATFLLSIAEENKVGKAFFLAQGFLDAGPYAPFETNAEKTYRLLVKPYKQEGLCRNIGW